MLKMLEPQPLVTGVTYKKPCTGAIAKEITHFFTTTNSVRTNRLKLLKINSFMTEAVIKQKPVH